MSYEIIGKLHRIYPVQIINPKFRKREIVVEITEEINGNKYINYAKMELVQSKCEIIEKFKEGEDVKVMFNIKGNRIQKPELKGGEEHYVTRLDAWRIEKQ